MIHLVDHWLLGTIEPPELPIDLLIPIPAIFAVMTIALLALG